MPIVPAMDERFRKIHCKHQKYTFDKQEHQCQEKNLKEKIKVDETISPSLKSV